MNTIQGIVGFVLFILITLGVSIAAHKSIKKTWIANIVGTLGSVVAFQIVVFLQLGYLDPFVLIAVFTSLIIALPICLLVGRSLRKRQA